MTQSGLRIAEGRNEELLAGGVERDWSAQKQATVP
jgi:hypothetical protein